MQKFNKGPGVYRQETDLSEVITPASTSVGALVGNSAKGPINQRVLVSTDKEWVDIFGNPDTIKWGIAGFAATEFLAESNALYFVRASNGTEQYANLAVSATGTTPVAQTIVATSSTALVASYPDGNKANNIYDLENVSPAGALFLVGAVGPGTDGANTAISITTSAGGNDGWDWRDAYDAVSTTATGGIISRQVFKIDVFRRTSEDSDFSGVSGSPVETWYVAGSLVKDGTGKSLYITDVINGNSQYIYIKVSGASPGAGDRTTFGLPSYTATGTVIALGNAGTDYNGEHKAGNIDSAYSIYSNKESCSINILINPFPVADFPINVANIAGNLRMDCIAVVQAGDSTDKTTDAVKSSMAYPTYPSYVAPYAGYSLLYDKYNDRNIYIPNCIYGAALMARTDRVANTWDAPAGLNRGILPVNGQNVLWSSDQIGTLYEANLNCVKRIPGAGYVMWGQKTAQQKKSALDRINVRRLLLYVENSVEPTLQYFLFENNTEKTRSRTFSTVDSFMKTVLAGGGVTAYQVVCDETNNPQSVIDNDQMNVDIYVQPARSIEFIKLQTIVTKTGVNFAELIV
jgi:hypothetical protein